MDAKSNPTSPNEQAAALAGTVEKKIGTYKTFTRTFFFTRPFGISAHPQHGPDLFPQRRKMSYDGRE